MAQETVEGEGERQDSGGGRDDGFSFSFLRCIVIKAS